MKIKLSQLRKIIREETQRVVESGFLGGRASGGKWGVFVDGKIDTECGTQYEAEELRDELEANDHIQAHTYVAKPIREGISVYSPGGKGRPIEMTSILAAHKALSDEDNGANPDANMLAIELGVPEDVIVRMIDADPESGLYIEPETGEVVFAGLHTRTS